MADYDYDDRVCQVELRHTDIIVQIKTAPNTTLAVNFFYFRPEVTFLQMRLFSGAMLHTSGLPFHVITCTYIYILTLFINKSESKRVKSFSEGSQSSVGQRSHVIGVSVSFTFLFHLLFTFLSSPFHHRVPGVVNLVTIDVSDIGI